MGGLNSPEALYEFTKPWRNKKVEHVWMLTVDTNLNLIKKRLVFKGLVNKCIVNPREVLYHAIKDLAHGVILVHNHPSGSLVPSGADNAITKRLSKACNIIGIQFIEHMIIAKEGYYSYQEANPNAFDV